MTRPDPLREVATSLYYAKRLDIPMIEHSLRTAHRQGQESMRERCANVAKMYIDNECAIMIDAEIRALEPETEGGV